MVSRMKIFNISEVNWKIQVLGGSQKIAGLTKKGGLRQFADLRGGLARMRGTVFEWEVDTPMHTMFLKVK